MVKKDQQIRSTKDTQRERAIIAILSTVSVKEASRVSGISYQTLRRLMDNPSFQVELREVKKGYLKTAVVELESTATLAVRKLRQVLEASHSSNMELVAAARAVLEFTERYSVAESLNDRVTALEKQTGKVIDYASAQDASEANWQGGEPISSQWTASTDTANATGASEHIEGESNAVRIFGGNESGFTRSWPSQNCNTVEAKPTQHDETVALPLLIK
jgi:hypothetical protein